MNKRMDLQHRAKEIVTLVNKKKGFGLLDEDCVYWFLFRYCKYHGVGIRNVVVRIRCDRVEIDSLNALYYRKPEEI